MTKKLNRKEILEMQDMDADAFINVKEPEVKKYKKKSLLSDPLVISILGLTAITNSAYAIIAPFLPFEFKRKGIDQAWIGYIFSIYSIAVIICSPLVGKMISILGRRNLVVFGMGLMGASFIMFGIMSGFDNKNVFIFLALLNRFL